ncbi:prolyl-tRNA synthetase, putative, partial [Perkinsus marinus ATCC 50983]
ELRDILLNDGARCVLDDDRKKRPGFKFTKWDLQGVPLSIRIGSREVETNTVTLAYRHTGEKVNEHLSCCGK